MAGDDRRRAIPTLSIRLWCAIAAVAVFSMSAGAMALEGGHLEQPSARNPQLRLAQVRSDAPRIAIAPVIIAGPGSKVRLQIAIEPSGAVPRQSFVRLRGLPPLVLLSGGHAISPGTWAVPLVGLGDLTITVPAGVAGQSDVTVSLVAEDGALIAEASTVLIVAPKPAAMLEALPRREVAPLTPADREAAEKLIARGERDLQDGNVAMARQFFLRAAEAGLARGALLLGGTYDQRELARQRAQGVQPNPALARKWYERARELGAPEAAERLANLGGG